MDYRTFFHQHVEGIKAQGRYRHFVPLQRLRGQFPKALWTNPDGTIQEVTVWCSNDYLGMGQNPKVLAAMDKALGEAGAGAGGTRNISGNTIYHEVLEASIADLHGKEAALVFSSGYVANETTLRTLGKILPQACYFSDANNHASMIQGMRHGDTPKHIFRHNDVDHLRSLLTSHHAFTSKIVALESVYSMDGDIAPLMDLLSAAKSHGGLTYVDEVHGVGLYGPRGGGILQDRNIECLADIIQGTLGKAFGLMGGYIAGDGATIDAIRCTAPGFIFTTSLPPVLLAGALASIEHLKTSQIEREKQQARVKQLRQALSQASIPFLDNESHIVPVPIPGAETCRLIAKKLLDHYAIYVQPINYPTVPVGKERLRLTPTALHTHAHVADLVKALSHIWADLQLARVA